MNSDNAPEPAVSVIVPHINQADYLRRCLESLNSQSFAGAFEIIVVDNGSHVLPAGICSSFDNVRLEQEPVPGPGPARNKGVALSRAPVLAFVDADCIADRNWLSTIVAAFGDGSIDVIGGDVRIAAENPSRLSDLEAYESVYAYRQREYIEKQGFSGAGNLAVRRSAFQAVGSFGGIEISEDRDWGKRASALGLVTHYVPEMLVFHPARKTIGELQVKWDRQVAHDFAELGAAAAARARWVAKAMALVVSPVVEAPRIMASDRLEGWRPKFRAGVTLARIRLHRARSMIRLLSKGSTSAAATSWNRT
jgi:glycosyltransferase involved in cell wall biosynthesis